MKRLFAFMFAFCCNTTAFSQAKIDGWYYLPQPAGNIWGIGYHRPKEGLALSYAGNEIKSVGDEDLITQPGPQSTQRISTEISNLVLTSLFRNNKAITYNINSYKLKQVLLKSNVYKDFDDGNFYITQALKADSVVITGKIDKTKGSSSKDAETLIQTFAKPFTVAFMVVSTLTNKDTTKNTGFISFSKNKNDSFTVVITDPEVYFAVKLTKVDNDDKTPKRVDRGKADETILIKYEDDPIDIISAHYKINKGLDVGVRFKISSKIATVEVYQKYGNKPDSVLRSISKQIKDKAVHFKIEGSTITPNQSTGTNESQDLLITAIASFIYEPDKMEIEMDDLDDNNKYQTAVYHVEGTYTTWP